MTQAKNRAQRIKKEMRIAFEAELVTNKHTFSSLVLSKKTITVRDMQVRAIGFRSKELTPCKITWIQKLKTQIDRFFYKNWGIILFTRDHKDTFSIMKYELQKDKIKTQIFMIYITSKNNEQFAYLLDPTEEIGSLNSKLAEHIRSYVFNKNENSDI